ncbi:MAG: tautomerase family protein [Spirochaetaceae bacterium]
MPIITITMGEIDIEMKTRLIKELTAKAVEITKIPEHSFTILINELGDDNIGIGGKTLKEFKQSLS